MSLRNDPGIYIHRGIYRDKSMSDADLLEHLSNKFFRLQSIFLGETRAPFHYSPGTLESHMSIAFREMTEFQQDIARGTTRTPIESGDTQG